MPLTRTPAEQANTHYQSGYSCAQSVLLTLYEYIGPDGKNDLIPKIASGFGGGIGRCGSVCGALTGSIMAVGIKYGSNDTALKKDQKFTLTQKRSTSNLRSSTAPFSVET